MLKRSLFLLLVLGVAIGTTLAQERILDPEVPTVAAHGKLWYANEGDLWEVDPSTRAMTRMEPRTRPIVGMCGGVRVDLFTAEDYPNMVRFTSQNSSLVPGSIRYLTCRSDGTLFAINRAGRVCSFNGRQWEILDRLCSDEGEHHLCYRDAITNGDSLRMITCGGVVTIDLRTHRTTESLSVPSWARHTVWFESWDVVRIKRLLDGVIDLGQGTVEIDESQFKTEWDSAAAGAHRLGTDMLKSTLALRNALMPSTPWTRSVDFEEQSQTLVCGLRCYGGGWIEQVFTIAVDNAGTLYIGTDRGVVVLPDTRGLTVQEEKEILATTTLAPNPARHWTTVELGDEPIDGTVCQVVDAAGRVVQRLTLVERTTRLDISGLAVGMYYLMVVSPRSRAVIPLRVSQ